MCVPIDVKPDSLVKNVKSRVNVTMGHIVTILRENVNVLPVSPATNAMITVQAVHGDKIARKRVNAKMMPNAIHPMANAFVPMAGKEQFAQNENVRTICMANNAI